MKIKRYFEYNPYIEVTAAQIGVSAWTWDFMSEEDLETARSVMKSNRYDVLPIKDANGEFRKHYVTPEWGDYQNIMFGDDRK
jgi:hypothetical protein